MRLRTRAWWLFVVLGGLLLGVGLVAQGSLSAQVLQLLTRTNTWTATNTFLDLRLIQGVPTNTALRFYVDNSNNLYFNGVLVAAAGGGVSPHTLLSVTHTDTVPAAVTRGAVIVGNATPAWAAVPLCAAGQYLGSNGTDTACLNTAAAFTNIPAAQLTGTAAPINGAAITALTAANLTGTVPLANLAGITTTQIAAGAGILRSQLSIPAGVVLTTDVTGVLPWANGGTGTGAAVNNATLVSNGSAWTTPAIPNCGDGTHALAFATSTNTFACQTLATGMGSVASVGLSVPTGFTVTGSPVTTSGTLALGLSSEAANLVWAGPTTGAATAPTFRALVNADFPTSGVSAGTYPVVTVNAQGLITSGTASVNLATQSTGTLPYPQGGTGVTVAGNNTVLIGSGSAWVPQTLPNCGTGLLGFTTATNLFNCATSVVASGWVQAGTATGAITTGDLSAARTATTAYVWMGSDGNGAFQRSGLAYTFAAGAGTSLAINNMTDSGSVPTITSGFGTSPAIAGRDYAFKLTLGSASGNTGGVVAFNAVNAFANAPVCEASSPDGTALATVATTTTALTLTWATGTYTGDVVHVLCRGY